MTPEQQKMVDSKLYTRQPEGEPPVRSSELVGTLDILGLNGDKIFERIRYDLDRGLIKEARSHLNFVDVMLNQCPNAPDERPGANTKD